MNPELLQFKASWKYYHFVRENVGNSNSACLNACCRSNLCLNGGTCTELCANQRRRFQCTCNKRYSGHRCEILSKPRSCAELKEAGISNNGWFNIYTTPNSKGTRMYCDFKSRDNITWTMVQSYRFIDSDAAGYFACSGTENHMVDDPFYFYYLGSVDKTAVRQRSSHWRATCEYDKIKKVDENYIVAKFDQVNLTASWTLNIECAKFEEINVLKTKCSNCSATVLRHCGHYDIYFVLLGNSSSRVSCIDKPTSYWLNEGYFGSGSPFLFSYFRNNPVFPCNRYYHSTTQFWFGSV